MSGDGAAMGFARVWSHVFDCHPRRSGRVQIGRGNKKQTQHHPGSNAVQDGQVALNWKIVGLQGTGDWSIED